MTVKLVVPIEMDCSDAAEPETTRAYEPDGNIVPGASVTSLPAAYAEIGKSNALAAKANEALIEMIAMSRLFTRYSR